MTTTTQGQRDMESRGRWASGLSLFAAVMLITVGAFQVVEGLAAIINDSFLVNVQGYVFELDTTAWGWTHLIIRAIAVVVGFCIAQGQVWARAAGICFAALSALANFFFLPFYPLWALVIIAVDVAVIWALAVHVPGRAGRAD